MTSAPIAKALVSARKRGVAVEAIFDKSQLLERYASATFLTNNKIFLRIGKSRFFIKDKSGPGVDGLFGTKKVMDNAKATAVWSFSNEFPKQINLSLSRKRP